MPKNYLSPFIIILATILIVLTACSPLVQAQSSATEPATEVQPVVSTATAAPTPQPSPDAGSTTSVALIALEQPFQKAAFQDGPFDFEFYLYQDRGFSQNPAMTWMYSDIPGVGSHVSWTYHGPVLTGDVAEAWGTCPDVGPRSFYPGLKDGDRGIREGGILLPQNAAPGPVVQFVFRLESSQGTYGGILSFVLLKGPDGYAPSRVTIFPVSQAGSTGGCITALQSSSMPTMTAVYPSGLSVEEHLLLGAPQVDPLAFTPSQGSQEDILRAHQKERENHFTTNDFTDQGQRALWVEWNGGKLIARETWNKAENTMGVEVILGDQTIYSAQPGAPSPVSPLQGLWAYDDHWALEVVNVSPQNPKEVAAQSDWVGEVIVDGTSLNQKMGYEEAFGFQLLRGRPFYFFKRAGQIGFSYDGQEIMLVYSQVPHYWCCSGAVLNPVRAEAMVAFFAQRDEKWYYVEIGIFK